MATVSTSKRRKSAVDEFIKAVRDAIETQGISIVELSEKCGLSRPYVSKVLSGHQRPSLDVAEKIAGAVGLELRTVATRR